MRIVHVSAPGAVLQAPGKPPEGRLKSILERWLNEGSIAMGMSVLPGSSQSWSRGLAWIGVRDTASIDTLVESGCTRVAYFPDLALLQEVSPSDFSGRVGNGLAFSFRRAFPESGDMDGYDDWLREALGRFIRSLPGEVRKQSVFFHQVDEDASFVAELALENSVRFKDEPLHITTYKDFYREFDLVVSNRLHCLLFGAACGAVPVALTDQRHTKLVSLFNGLGWGNLLILRNGEASETSRFREILAGGQGIRPNLASALERQRDIAQAAIPVMLDSLSGRP
jgi:hypothetical protein